jgi:leucyl aminopeptidase
MNIPSNLISDFHSIRKKPMLNITFSSAASLPNRGALILTVAAERKLGGQGTRIDRKLRGALKRAMADSAFTGAKEQTLTIMAPAGTRLTRLVLVGIGEAEKVNEVSLQRVGGAALAALGNKDTQATWMIDDHKGLALAIAEVAAQVAYGARLRSYRFDKYRTTLKPDQKPQLKTLTVSCSDVAKARAAYVHLDKIADGVFFTRDLVSEPPNVINPVTLAKECEKLKALGVKVDVLDEKQMKKLGMGSLLGVAQGSITPARLVCMTWNGRSSGKDKRPIAFVGKGVTFDSGGLSLKPPGGMEDMKWDMAGAGAVIGAMKALAGRKAKANVIGIVGLVENMPSSTAQRPGDVVTSMSGQTIEVLNTDAEGRLVLADALWYTQEKFKPRCIIDLATLTGAIIVALGHENSGLFSNDDQLAEKLLAAGKDVEEPLWRLPLGEAYDRQLDSPIADMKNIGNKGESGSITAAQFLQRFIKNGTPWAHLDIAGTAWLGRDKPVCPKGATAFGVRLLDRFVANTVEM